MTTRYYAEEPCPHGRLAEIGHVENGYDDRTMDYRPPEGKDQPNHWCPGGSRRELTDVETVEAESLLQSGWFVKVPKRGTYAIIPLPPEADE